MLIARIRFEGERQDRASPDWDARGCRLAVTRMSCRSVRDAGIRMRFNLTSESKKEPTITLLAGVIVVEGGFNGRDLVAYCSLTPRQLTQSQWTPPVT